jgi:hypothetical protein
MATVVGNLKLLEFKNITYTFETVLAAILKWRTWWEI